ncbi:glycoside hydrolase family 95 protein [Thalassotalea agarivorans]|uniref:Alpha-L-fucosidase 2 n=1 Tax=Thalassotalea agarivorans TaxID=349064 RepID=A0A1I0GZ59_THASX|nr:glycoside hydrolase family 95 protein [Thalassotalea agarivorans]SET75650.1 alpha-L-fucosidase 2 [Thalassotalea agarivorans]
MFRFLTTIFACTTSIASFAIDVAASEYSDINPHTDIWYKQSAQHWDHALPLGNGRLGAMVFGGIHKERIQLNEDTIWAGQPTDTYNKGSKQQLDAYRKALFAGDIKSVDDNIMADFSINLEPKRSHQTLGDLTIAYHYAEGPLTVRNYQRKLSLDNALSTVNYTVNQIDYKRETLVSQPEQVLATRLTSSAKNAINIAITLSRPFDNGHQTAEVSVKANQIVMKGQVTQHGGIDPNNGAGVMFYGLLGVKLDSGAVNIRQGQLVIEGANTVEIYFSANSNFYNERYIEKTQNELARALSSNWQQIKARHIDDFQRFAKRSSLKLSMSEHSFLPTDQRLAQIKAGEQDPSFSALYYHFGRYLLISSSRQNTQPANLQGLWNNHIRAPWNGDYHLNINLQMNYWPADLTNLSELQYPLFDFIERLAERGRKRAKDSFGARGWVSPHASDIWAPAWTRARKAKWGLSHISNAWLMSHMVESYRYSKDKQFLMDTVYPLLKEVCLFYFDWLVKHPDTGQLVSGPSASPENEYLVLENGQWVARASTMGPAIDQQIISELFSNMLYVANELAIEDTFIAQVNETQSQLSPGLKIDESNRIMEWFYPYQEAEPGHRHISHLYALYPGNTIHPINTPKLAAAARNTIEHRLKHGGAATGWSRAWMINFMARLHDGEAAKHHLDVLYQKSTSINLFDFHPPFQIDGNFGATAAIVEMIVQSHGGFIDLLPALPSEWQTGTLLGVKARGGIVIDIQWNHGQLTQAALSSPFQQTTVVRHLGQGISITTSAGESVKVEQLAQGKYAFDLKANQLYLLSTYN